MFTGHIIFLEYNPPGPAKKTLMLVGKGVTYDTGGADIKYGGVMAGMSRDKCGAAAVAGFMKVNNTIILHTFSYIYFSCIFIDCGTNETTKYSCNKCYVHGKKFCR